MEQDFWHERWRRNELGFHEQAPNSLLVRSFINLDLKQGDRVLLPLCGKTRDIGWLTAQGCRVVGVELSRLAIEQLYSDLGLVPTVATYGQLARYHAGEVEMFVGDFFDLDKLGLGPVHAVYDRAALVALPQDMRRRYTAHLTAVTDMAPQLLICFDYDQSQMDGPPFSVPGEEVRRHYGHDYEITAMAQREVADRLKGKVAATEQAWLLRAKPAF